jgi:hypothetical protein
MSEIRLNVAATKRVVFVSREKAGGTGGAVQVVFRTCTNLGSMTKGRGNSASPLTLQRSSPQPSARA